MTKYSWPPGALAPERVLVPWPHLTRPHVPYRFAALPGDGPQHAACSRCRQPVSRTRGGPWMAASDEGECPGADVVEAKVGKADVRAALLLIALYVAPEMRAPRDALDRLHAAAKTEEWR